MTSSQVDLPEDLPAKPSTSSSGSVGANGSPSRVKRVRQIALIVGSLVAISLLHVQAERAHATLSVLLVLRQLYLLPILYAAWLFGKRGGLVAAIGATIPYLAHAHTLAGPNSGRTDFDNWIEVLSYVGLGLVFGMLRDIEEDRARELTTVSTELNDAYRKLEDRALQLMNVQDYTTSILHSIASGVFTVNHDGSVTTANPAAERMLGMSEYEMVPKRVERVFLDDDGLAEDVRKVLSGRLPLVLRDASIVTCSGERRHVQATTSRMVTRGVNDLGAVVTIEDISELRALTDQLIRADRLAAMGELTAGLAHEVRNPLGIIRVSVQLLEDAKCDPDRIHEAAGVIKQEIDRLDKVIKALLDFGRPSRPMMVALDLRTVLNDVVLFTDHFAKQAGVRIQMETMRSELPVLGDPDQLKQVFLNLVTNAVQAMEESGGSITIEAGDNGDYVTVSVSDTGPGIPEEELKKVFDPFFTMRAEGTGLGLTIVHRIIDAHSGRIRVDSTPGKGTTFVVTLPVVREERR